MKLKYPGLLLMTGMLQACGGGAMTMEELPENISAVNGKQADVMGYYCVVEGQSSLVAGLSCAFPLPDSRLLLVFEGTSRLDAKRIRPGCWVGVRGLMKMPANAGPVAEGMVPKGSTLRVKEVISYDEENCIE